MPGMLSPCKNVVWLISAPVAINSTRRSWPAASMGSILQHSTAALHPAPLPAPPAHSGPVCHTAGSRSPGGCPAVRPLCHLLSAKGPSRPRQVTGENRVKCPAGGCWSPQIAQQRGAAAGIMAAPLLLMSCTSKSCTRPNVTRAPARRRRAPAPGRLPPLWPSTGPWGALGAVFQWCAELPFCCAKMLLVSAWRVLPYRTLQTQRPVPASPPS